MIELVISSVVILVSLPLIYQYTKEKIDESHKTQFRMK